PGAKAVEPPPSRPLRLGHPPRTRPRVVWPFGKAHIVLMAKSPDSKKPKDPARVTRAKAAREPLAPIAPALEKLLNPGIAKGTAGVGSQTGLTGEKPAPRSGRLPGEGAKEAEPKTGLRPPADNSWDRREDFSAAHRARKSTREGAPSAPASQLPSSHERSEWRGGVGGGGQSSANTSTP